MAVSEQLRHQLYSKLEQVLGRDEAAALIEYFPPQGWNDVARRADLDAAASDLRSEMRAQFTEMRGDIAGLRGELHEQLGSVRAEIGDVRAELHEQIGSVRGEIGGLRGEMGSLRAELHEQIGSVRGEIGSLRGEMGSLRAEMRTQTRSLFLSLVGLQITGAGIAVALSRTL